MVSAVAGQADGSTAQPACADQVRHGPPQAPRSAEALRRSASDQLACRWALLERGSVQSILGMAGALTKRKCSPLTTAAHVAWYGGGASNQKAVPLGLGRSMYVDEMAPAGNYLSVAAVQSANPLATACTASICARRQACVIAAAAACLRTQANRASRSVGGQS